MSESDPTGTESNRQQSVMNGGRFILNLQLFAALEYQLLEYYYIPNFAVRYLYYSLKKIYKNRRIQKRKLY